MLPALSHAWQSWKSARAVAALAVVAFAVGIGSATAIYTVVNGVMLRPLPYADGQRFVALYGGTFSEPRQRAAHTFPDLHAYQERAQSFDVFGRFRPASFNLTFAGQPQHVVGTEVTPSLAGGLGVNPIVGQWFSDDRGVVISSAVWRRLGADGQMWQSTRQTLRHTLTGLSRAVTFSDDGPREPDADLLTEFVAAARGATSFADAFQRALTTLRDRLGASSVVLLHEIAGEYRAMTAVPRTRDRRRCLWAAFWRTGCGPTAIHCRSPPPISRAGCAGRASTTRDMFSSVNRCSRAPRGWPCRCAPRARSVECCCWGRAEARPNSGPETQLLRQCADQLTLMLENAKLTTRVVEQEKMRRDVALAAEVQRRLLPEHPPHREGSVLTAVSLPARTVGGDYYDFLDLGDQRIGIALADIAGKGVAAALIMAVVQASLRIVAAEEGTSLPELVAKMSGFLHRSTGSNSYATFFYAQLDEGNRQLKYVNAGHNPPFLLRPTAGTASGVDEIPQSEIRELSIGGTVLGLFPQMSYEEATVDLQPGDVLVALTDGVTEALNIAEEEFGEERLKDLLRSVVHLPASEISARISDGLKGWIKDTPQFDDLTFVVMKVN